MSARGLALVTVLWVLTLLSLIAASFTNSTRTEIKLAFNQAEAARAEALADAGIHIAVLGLLSTDPERQWRVDGTVYGWQFGEGEIRVNVWDEGGKIDLNVAAEPLLQALFVALGETSQDAAVLADRIVDFRDPNDLKQLNGAEDRDYYDAGLPYGAKDAPFEAVEELRQVFGMTPALFEAAAPALTVRARQRSPHEPTASPLVKAALSGAGPITAGGDSELAALPEDVGPEAEGEEAEVALAPVPLAGTGEGQTDLDVELPTRSRINVFTVHAEARVNSGAIFVREAVVEIGTGGELPYTLWSWKQGTRTLFPVPEAEP